MGFREEIKKGIQDGKEMKSMSFKEKLNKSKEQMKEGMSEAKMEVHRIKKEYKEDVAKATSKQEVKQHIKKEKQREYDTALKLKKSELRKKPKSGVIVFLEFIWTLVLYVPILIVVCVAAFIGIFAIILTFF